jgi:hypothetical protein
MQGPRVAEGSGRRGVVGAVRPSAQAPLTGFGPARREHLNGQPPAVDTLEGFAQHEVPLVRLFGGSSASGNDRSVETALRLWGVFIPRRGPVLQTTPSPVRARRPGKRGIAPSAVFLREFLGSSRSECRFVSLGAQPS